MTQSIKKTLIHIAAIAIMLLAAVVYFSPVLSGEQVYQGDIQKAEAMRHSQDMAAQETGEIPNWTPSMFSGMPGYQIASEPPKTVFTLLKSLLIMRPLGVERNIGMLWLYLIGFYVALIAFGCSPWLALVGALAFGLGSYNIIICEAGHITKGWAIAMIAPVLAGMALAFKSHDENADNKLKLNWKRLVWGAILFTLAVGLQITFNHIQITYYTVIGGVIMGLTYLFYSLKEKWFAPFLTIVGILLVGCLFAVGGNYRHLAVNQEYAKATMRGGSEITVKPNDKTAPAEATQSGGLDIGYAFSWSYGVGETYTLLVPGAMGGGSGEKVAADSEWARRTGQTQAPLYWGDQPFTSGPVYFGAIVVFLFLLGCLVVKGPERWWIIIATIVAIVMSWGRNFMVVNEFLFNALPMYNKFRTPSMSLVLANATMVLMACLALKALFDTVRHNDKPALGKKAAASVDDVRQRMNRALYIATGVIAGILIIGLILAKSKLEFTGGSDAQYEEQMGQNWPMLRDLLVGERQALFVRDTWRSLAFVLMAAAAIWLYINGKLKKKGIVVALIGVLVVVDLWGVDRRYLNNDNFVDPMRLELRKDATDMQLDRVAEANGDVYYRVFDLTVNTFNDSRPSAFHNQIGGYSAAKLRRYQDLIDFYLGSQSLFDYVNSCQIMVSEPQSSNAGGPLLYVSEPYPVLDMLNARYLMLNLQNGPYPVRRTSALGNCWIVDEVQFVEDANAEIQALGNFDPRRTAIVDRSQWGDKLGSLAATAPDSSESISLVPSKVSNPDHLTYKSHTNGERVAVFSEIFYAPDWRAYIDGQPVDYFRADYVLRALVLPAGDHTIDFINEAPTLHRTDTLTLIVSLLMLLVMGGALVLVYRKKDNKEKQ